MTKAIYPGSFDPVTLGHLDLIRRSSTLFDSLVVAVTNNRVKQPLFTLEERVAMLQEVTADIEGVQVDSFSGLLVDYARSKGAQIVLRGLRAISDFEYEFQMALTNRKIDPVVNTVFMMPSEEFSYLSSSIIREIASLGGDVTPFVPAPVVEKLRQKFPG
ncbi:MAG TPA: pantetheine-phosphate adenylyltransferase [bacterium]|nr:pantetheine-phosphate adenylyltransferase [bacterium]